MIIAPPIRYAILFGSLFITGCARLLIFDGAPDVPLKPEEIKEITPVYEPLSRAGNMKSYEVFGKTYHVLDKREGFTQTGTASWYGTGFHGNTTSNGETYDMYKLSAAHKSLPLPAYLRVTNLDNGLSTIVRVNDRGPFHSDRIIDLSYAAAVKLGYADIGTATVKLESIVPPSPQMLAAERARKKREAEAARIATVTTATLVQPVIDAKPLAWEPTEKQKHELEQLNSNAQFLQVAAFSDRSNAEKLVAKLTQEQLPSPTLLSFKTGDNLLFRVRIGPIKDEAELDQLQQKLMTLGLTESRITKESPQNGDSNSTIKN